MSEFILTKNDVGTDPIFSCPNCGFKTAHTVCELSTPGPGEQDEKIQIRFIKCKCLSCKGESYLMEKFKNTVIDTDSQPLPDDNDLCWHNYYAGVTPKTVFAIVPGTAKHKIAVIIDQKFIEPDVAMNVPPVNNDLNQRSQDLYNEAASIMNKSPRAAAALMRLALEVMLEENFGLTSGTINKRLGELYSGGIPDEIDTALHYVRIAGNAADHTNPGLINLDGEDGINTVMTLFSVLNCIVEDQVSRKKKLSGLAKFFTSDEQKGIDHLHAKNQPEND